jgi:hypothetical protein
VFAALEVDTDSQVGGPVDDRARRADLHDQGVDVQDRVHRVQGGEWPGGISPPGSLRSRREPLGSPGSHHPADGCARIAQWANRVGARLLTSANHLTALVAAPRNLLYFLMAQRAR